MMVSITCTNCKAVLTVDDAFVGGVCRCQFCGTIQTVPRKTPRPASPEPVAAHAPKTLYQNESRVRAAIPSGTGLDELASAVASSSGLSGSGLTQQSQTAAQPATREPSDSPHRLMPILIGSSIAVVVLLLLLLVVLAWRTSNRVATAPNSTGTPDVITGPSFCGIPVQGRSVIFLVDRANSIGELFDTVKATCYKTLRQLGPDRKFQVILWDNDSGSAEFPPGQMRNATAGVIEDCQRDFQDLTASGSSHLSGPMHEALDRHPQAIIIVTSKSELDDDDTAAVKAALDTGIRIDAVQVGAASICPVLDQVTKATGGQLKFIYPTDLREFSR